MYTSEDYNEYLNDMDDDDDVNYAAFCEQYLDDQPTTIGDQNNVYYLEDKLAKVRLDTDEDNVDKEQQPQKREIGAF